MGLNAAEAMDVFYSRCLLCACKPVDFLTPHLHIFSVSGIHLKLAEKISKYLNRQIVAELPQNVCYGCLAKLEVTHQLVTGSEQASITLLQIKQQSGHFSQQLPGMQVTVDCSLLEMFSSYQPAEIHSEMDITANEIPLHIPDSAEFDRSVNDILVHFDQSVEEVGMQFESSTNGSEEQIQPSVNESTVQMEQPSVNESTVQMEQPSVNESTVQMEQPSVNESTVQMEQPSVNESTVQMEQPSVNESTVQMEQPSVNESTVQMEQPSVNESTVQMEQPSVNESTVQMEQPSVNESTVQMEQPSVNESTVQMEQPSVNESTVQMEQPSANESTIQMEQPSITEQFEKLANDVIVQFEQTESDFVLFEANAMQFEGSEVQIEQSTNQVAVQQSTNPVAVQQSTNLVTVQQSTDPVAVQIEQLANPVAVQMAEEPLAVSTTKPLAAQERQRRVMCDYGGVVWCELCGKRARNKYSLIAHKNQSHASGLSFDCEHCGQSYSAVSKVLKHIRDVHVVKDEICQLCGKSFTKSQYISHLKWHQANPKVRPFKSVVWCAVCKFRAKNKFLLVNHINNKHLDMVGGHLLPFCCDMCDKQYAFYSQLLYHKNGNAHEPKQRCRHCGRMINKLFMDSHLKLHKVIERTQMKPKSSADKMSVPKKSIKQEPVEDQLIPIEPIQHEPVQKMPIPIESIQQESIDKISIPIKPIQQESVEKMPIPIKQIQQEPVEKMPISKKSIQQESEENNMPIPTKSIQQEPNEEMSIKSIQQEPNEEITEIGEKLIHQQPRENQLGRIPQKNAPLKLEECRVVLQRLLECTLCEFYTDNKNQLASHMQAHLQAPNTADEVMCRCSCTDETLKDHMIVLCDQCGQMSRGRPAMPTRHLPISFYACRFCAASYIVADQLRLHVQEVHSLVPCTFCRDIFHTETDLCLHMSDVHKATKHHCTHCHKYSTYKRHEFDKHLLDCEHMFTCMYCDKNFKSEQFLNYHVYDVHLGPLLQA